MLGKGCVLSFENKATIFKFLSLSQFDFEEGDFIEESSVFDFILGSSVNIDFLSDLSFSVEMSDWRPVSIARGGLTEI